MLELGPELFELLNAKQSVGNRSPVIYGTAGLSSAELASIESQVGFRLPEDFSYLLRNVQDPGGVLFPWTNFEKQEYDKAIAGVLKGIEFDIKHNAVWLQRWGERPADLSVALGVCRAHFATWPGPLSVYCPT